MTFYYVRNYRTDENQCYESLGDVAKALNVSISVVNRAIADHNAIDHNFITIFEENDPYCILLIKLYEEHKKQLKEITNKPQSQHNENII